MRGYSNLTDFEKKVFDTFKKEFLKVNDGRIDFVDILRKNGYLRVDFKINGRKEWLHVTPYSWY